MLSHLPQREKYGLGVLLVVVFGGLGWFGGRTQSTPPPIEIKQYGDAPKVEKPAESEVVVDVVGAVKTPGVQHLSASARVEDAIKAAGGATSDANTEELNLAAKLVDGTQLYVPHLEAAKNKLTVAEPYSGGKSSAQPYSAHPQKTTHGTAHRSSVKEPSGPVSLNTSTLEQLQTIPGVGPSTAERIAAYRQAHGGFSSIEEIQAVQGIGPKKFEKMRKFLRL